MKTVEITPEAIQAAAGVLPQDGPITMLNLLRYKDRAEYDGPIDLPPGSGREVYFGRYVPAFNKVAAGANIKVFWVANVLAAVVAPAGERWDDVAIVEYPDYATFRRVVESPEYAADAALHRRAALEDWRLIATLKMDLPG